MRTHILKVLSLFFAAVMLLGMLQSVAYAASDTAYVDVNAFAGDSSGIAVGEKSSVTFSAEINGLRILSNVGVYNTDGEKVADMHYDKATRKYIANALLNATAASKNVYHVEVNGREYGSYELRFYNELTDADFKANDATWAVIKNMRTRLEASGASNETIYKHVFNYLNTDKNVAEVWYENSTTLNFDSVAGISNVFTIFEKNAVTAQQREASEAEFDAMISQMASENVEPSQTKSSEHLPTNTTIGIFGPYYGIEDDFTLHYNTMATQIIRLTGGTIKAFFGKGNADFPACNVASFKNMDRYGIIMIDSHGTDYGGGCCICVDTPGQYSQTDVSQGHLVVGYDYIGVRGSYMAKYSTTLPNSIVYVGSCYGMKADSIYSPLLAKGANLVMGYTNPVSFPYEKRIFELVFNKLRAVNEATGDYYTVGEAARDAIDHFEVPYDPYSDYKATFIYKGDGDAAIATYTAPVPIESVTLSESDITIVPGESVQLTLTINPNTANKYTVTWATYDEDTATVSDTGLVTAVEEGRTVVYCEVVDNTSYIPQTYTASCKIRVSEPAGSTFTVRFLDWDGTVLKTEQVESGKAATAPADPARDGYVFTGWNKDFQSIKADTDVTATYGMSGDANGDNEVNTGDAALILRYSVGGTTFTAVQMLISDANGDGEVNTGDATSVLHMAINS